MLNYARTGLKTQHTEKYSLILLHHLTLVLSLCCHQEYGNPEDITSVNANWKGSDQRDSDHKHT